MRAVRGWLDDVKELNEMTQWNMNCRSPDVLVGTDWRKRIAKVGVLDPASVVKKVLLPVPNRVGCGLHAYIDASRAVSFGCWCGVT